MIDVRDFVHLDDHGHSLVHLVCKFKGLRILVAGDPMYDVYHFGRVDRMCPEAPVPVFVDDGRVHSRLGGAANVVQNLRDLGCRVTTLFPRDPWVEKHRYMVGSHQLLRIDLEQRYNVDWFNLAIHDLPKGVIYESIVISDYDKGSCTEENIRWLMGEREKQTGGKPLVIVDPKGSDWHKYRDATVICPNHKEMIESPEKFMLIAEKCGAIGIRLHLGDGGPALVYPAKAKHVFDVTGAGDTVTAVIAAVMAAQGNMFQACELANLAAAVVVGEVGTSTCSAERLIQEITRS
jgi:D-beta-D-heptose 7-phosphate kinase/D-beta-D-heptose 1-phosphate adenosyltransferase